MIRKLTKHKKTIRYDANAAAVMPIYQRATQSISLAESQSDPARVVKIQAEAQERRDRRPQKTRALVAGRRLVARPEPWRPRYAKLPSGQIVGSPQTMREVKRTARQSRLQRRRVFREAKGNSNDN